MVVTAGATVAKLGEVAAKTVEKTEEITDKKI